jgi:hypothetical protein
MSADDAKKLAQEIAAGEGLSTLEIARRQNTSPATVFRWISKGLPGPNGHRVHLTAIRRGKKWLSSIAALTRFFAALPSAQVNNAPTPSLSRSRSASARSSADRFASEALKRKGF